MQFLWFFSWAPLHEIFWLFIHKFKRRTTPDCETWPPKQEEGECTLLLTWRLWKYFAISLLWYMPVWDHSRSLSFCECWNSRQPGEATSIAAAYSSYACGRLSHRYWFGSWQKLSWESLQSPLQKWGDLWITGQTMHMDDQASPLWGPANPRSATPAMTCRKAIREAIWVRDWRKEK